MKLIASLLPGARARQPKCTLPLLLALVLTLGVLLAAGCSDDEGTVTFPQPEPAPSRDWLFAVHGTDPNNVYAAGNRGAMFHFDGTDWSYVDIGADQAITRIWGPGDGTLLACGHGGKIWRNTGGSWSPMESGTSQDLYNIGDYQGDVHVCGRAGALRILNGSSWGSTNTDSIVVRNPVDLSALDTLQLKSDIYSLTTVNYYFFGGAFKDPDWIGEPNGMVGTDGMVMGEDVPPFVGDPPVQAPKFDWRMRTLRGDQLAASEWVLSSSSDETILSNNYLGTSEGWLFTLGEELTGALVWRKMFPDMTDKPGAGIRAMWMDSNANLYMVTDQGQVIFQTPNYNFDENQGLRKVLFDGTNGLSSIWGSDTDNIYFVGLVENTIYKAALDLSDTTLVVDPITVDFPAKGKSIDPFVDELGRPRF